MESYSAESELTLLEIPDTKLTAEAYIHRRGAETQRVGDISMLVTEVNKFENLACFAFFAASRVSSMYFFAANNANYANCF
jgi:hypothetical protein